MTSIIKKIRPRRCQLSVPASSKKMIEKAASIKVDGVILDLEDSVAPDQKESARHQIIDGLTQLDWKASSVSIRINATTTEWCHQDIIELVSNCSEKIATLIVPMVNTSNDLLFVETLIEQLAIKHSSATLFARARVDRRPRLMAQERSPRALAPCSVATESKP